MPPSIDLDKLFCSTGKRYGLPKLLLKAVATVESSLNPEAYRFEQEFWNRYLKNHEYWKNEDPKKVSASYGLFQVMFVTAYEAGFSGRPEELYNPVYNTEIGAKILSRHLRKVEKDGVHVKTGLWPVAIACCRYNGGLKGNPGPDGKMRNWPYWEKVLSAWRDLQKKEAECD